LNAQGLGSRPLADLLHEDIGGIRQVGECGRGFGRAASCDFSQAFRSMLAAAGSPGEPQTEAVGGDEGGDGRSS
jgi:hypothetical protein